MVSALGLCLALAACGSSSLTPSAAVPAASSSDAGAGPSAPSASATSAATLTATPKPAVAAPCTKRALEFDPKKIDLTGAWLGDDEGIYYLRQVGKTLWWSGMSGQAGPPAEIGREWNNVAVGPIKDDLTIELQWADVPRGDVMGGGTLVWKIVDDGTGNTKLTKVSETGTGFGGAVFTPCAPG